MKILKPLLTSCSILSIGVSGVAAQDVESQIIVTLSEAPNTSSLQPGDEFFAKLSYSTASLTGEGEEILSLSESNLSLKFNFGGFTYNESSDIATGYPQLHFSDASLVSIDFWNTAGLQEGSDNSFFRFFKDRSFNYSTDGVSEYAGEYRISAVPEAPNTMLLGLAGVMFLCFRKRM